MSWVKSLFCARTIFHCPVLLCLAQQKNPLFKSRCQKTNQTASCSDTHTHTQRANSGILAETDNYVGVCLEKRFSWDGGRWLGWIFSAFENIYMLINVSTTENLFNWYFFLPWNKEKNHMSNLCCVIVKSNEFQSDVFGNRMIDIRSHRSEAWWPQHVPLLPTSLAALFAVIIPRANKDQMTDPMLLAQGSWPGALASKH